MTSTTSMKIGLLSAAIVAAAALVTTPARAQKDPLENHPGIRNYHRIEETIAAAGQPEDSAWADIKKAGFATVINLRTEEEGSLEERAKVEAQGLKYVNIPIGSDGFSPDKVAEFAEIIAKADESPVLVHCASSNRVGAMWYIHQVLNKGVDESTALAEGKEAGLTSERLEQSARDYVQTHKK